MNNTTPTSKPASPATSRTMVLVSMTELLWMIVEAEADARGEGEIERINVAYAGNIQAGADVQAICCDLSHQVARWTKEPLYVLDGAGLGDPLGAKLTGSGADVCILRRENPCFKADARAYFSSIGAKAMATYQLAVDLGRIADESAILEAEPRAVGVLAMAFAEGAYRPAKSHEAASNSQSAPRVTQADIEASIASEHYFTGQHGVDGAMAALQLHQRTADTDTANGQQTPQGNPLGGVIFCVLVTRVGQLVTGESFCADPANPDQQRGRDEARRRAVDKLWPMAIYAERKRIADDAAPLKSGEVVYDRVWHWPMTVAEVGGGNVKCVAWNGDRYVEKNYPAEELTRATPLMIAAAKSRWLADGSPRAATA